MQKQVIQSQSAAKRSIRLPAASIDGRDRDCNMHLLEWDHVRLTPEKLAQYARTIERKGVPIGIVWGFVDGKIRAIARPTQ